ncbi:glycoside hydrolase family 15 [Cellulomonas sp. URHB0016]
MQDHAAVVDDEAPTAVVPVAPAVLVLERSAPEDAPRADGDDGEPDGRLAASADGSTSTAAGSSTGNAAGSWAGTAAGSSTGNATGGSTGNAAGSRAGNAAGSSAGNAAGSWAGNAADGSAGRPTDAAAAGATPRSPAAHPLPRDQHAASGPHGPRTPPTSSRPTRRTIVQRVTALSVVILLGAALVPQHPVDRVPAAEPAPARLPTYAHIDLYQEGVTVTAGGRRAEVAPGRAAPFFTGTHVLDPAAVTLVDALGGLPRTAASPGTSRTAAAAQAAAQRAWLAHGTVPGSGGPYEDMARAALLDLDTLDLPGGAAVAGWSEHWRYVWPRDSAFVAVALARTGHVDDALEVLGFLDRVQAPDGSFQARYEPDGSGPPDDRGVQVDGTGWAVWAAGLVLAEVPDPGQRRSAAARLRPLVVRSTEHALRLVAETGLPPASADYWETPEQELTLGTAAPIVAGLQQAAVVLPLTGDVALAQAASEAAGRSRLELVRAFAPTGYARYAAGGHRDAATAFLLPPFLRVPPPGARTAWRESAPTMLRPASGLAPGAGWRDDGVSWTPQTSLYAWLAAESGDVSRAHGWLDFLDGHRTATGSIPEKVLADGSPAAVAPLAWSAACTLLAIDALDRRDDRLASTALPPG